MDKITKEILEDLYVRKMLTMQEIADKLGYCLTTIYKYIHIFDIKPLKTWNRYGEISEKHMSIIRGSLLGDATIPKPRFDHLPCTAAVRFVHSSKQREYIDWKYSFLSEISTIPPNEYSPGHVEFKTMQHPTFLQMRHDMYPFGKKVVTKEYLSKLDELSIAVWYADDGCLTKNRNTAEIYTSGFTLEENVEIVSYFKNRWGIDWKIRMKKTRNKYYPVIWIGGKDKVDKLFDLVRPHIPECMKYKIRG